MANLIENHWTKFQKGRAKTGGRKKGTKNKVTRQVKDVLNKVFEDIGGEEAMAEFAKDNPTEFYKLYNKLLPTQIDANVNVSGPMVEAIMEGRKRASSKSGK